MDELISQMKEATSRNIAIATAIRSEDPEKSFYFWKMAELMQKAAEELKRNIPQEIEMEGGGTSWWYVCPECHGAVDNHDAFCRHCGQKLK